MEYAHSNNSPELIVRRDNCIKLPGDLDVLIVTPPIRDKMFNLIGKLPESENHDIALYCSPGITEGIWASEEKVFWIEPCDCFEKHNIKLPSPYLCICHCSAPKRRVDTAVTNLLPPQEFKWLWPHMVKGVYGRNYYTLTPREAGWLHLVPPPIFLSGGYPTWRRITTWLHNVSTKNVTANDALKTLVMFIDDKDSFYWVHV